MCTPLPQPTPHPSSRRLACVNEPRHCAPSLRSVKLSPRLPACLYQHLPPLPACLCPGKPLYAVCMSYVVPPPSLFVCSSSSRAGLARPGVLVPTPPQPPCCPHPTPPCRQRGAVPLCTPTPPSLLPPPPAHVLSIRIAACHPPLPPFFPHGSMLYRSKAPTAFHAGTFCTTPTPALPPLPL